MVHDVRDARDLTPDHSFGPTKTAAVDGTTLAYREEGSGEPVVFVHGAVSDLRTWEHQLPTIGERYRAIAYSRRFHRPNDEIAPSAPDPWTAHVDDLVSFLVEIGAAPAHLVGNSQGGFINLLAAIRHPEVVRSLTIEEAPVLSLYLSTPPRPTEMLRLFAARPRLAWQLLRFGAGVAEPARKAFARGDDERATRIFVEAVLGHDASQGLSEARWRQIEENLAPIRAFLLQGEFPSITAEEVRGIQAPSLLVTGEHSPTFLLRLTDCLEEYLPNVERAEIPSASHLMHEDNPEALNQAILDFLVRRSQD